MKLVFADTSFYVALVSRRDQHHQLALELSQSTEHAYVVSEFVLIELGSAFSKGPLRQRYTVVIQQLREDPDAIIVPASDMLFEKAFTLFETRPDKEWSLVDCSSFALMHEYGITEALTSDHHFEQAGFTILLK